MTGEEETTHIRVTKALKQELLDHDGHNFSERIRNYARANNNVNDELTREDVEALRDSSEDSSGLEYDEVVEAVLEGLGSLSIRPSTGEVIVE